jgi:hypothetical protein
VRYSRLGAVGGQPFEQIVERVAAYRKRGDLIVGGFLHAQEAIDYFGARVPLVREFEDAEEDSVDAGVLASAGLGRRAHTRTARHADGCRPRLTVR